MKDLMTGSINLSIRAFTAFSKFALIFVLAKYLEPADVGLFSITNTTLTLASLLLGLDFYTFSTRELLTTEKGRGSILIRDQMILHLIMYVIAIPVLLAIFYFDIMPWSLASWFFPILFFDLISQEIYRLLNAFSKPVFASWTYFLRSALWALILALFLVVSPNFRDLFWLWPLWLMCLILSCAIAIPYKRILTAAWLEREINWAWLKTGVRVATPFLMASVLSRAILLIDRYFIKIYWGDEALGPYSFFSTISNIVFVLAETGAIMILYPRLIELFHQKKWAEYQSVFRKFTFSVIGICLLATLFCALTIEPLLNVLQKDVYREALPLFWILLGSNILFVFGHIPQYGLYSQRQDRPIIISTVISFAVSVILMWILVPKFQAIGAAWATFAGCLLSLMLRSFWWIRLQRR
jgi:O-antigen/teichoic acid export membrane protein